MPYGIAAAAVALVGAGVSAYGQSQSGKAQGAEARIAGNAEMREGAMRQALAEQEARDYESQARGEAEQIKKAAMQVRGQMLVSQGASGTMIGEGSAQAALDQLDTLATADTLAALYSGVNRASAARTGGRFAQEAGVQRGSALQRGGANLERAARIGVTGTLIGGVGSALGSLSTVNFKTTPGYSGTQAPAPVVNRDLTASNLPARYGY